LTANPRTVSYNMFKSANDRSDGCLEVSANSDAEADSVSECFSGTYDTALSFEVRSKFTIISLIIGYRFGSELFNVFNSALHT
jgi:hypothetical protein